MKCPKCGFNSFEYLDTCKKCKADLTSFKASHHISPVIIPIAAAHKPPDAGAPAQLSAELPRDLDNFLLDNPAIITAPGETGAAEASGTAAGLDPFAEFSFDQQPEQTPASEAQGWDTPASSALLGNGTAQHELPDLFGDLPPTGTAGKTR